MARVLVVGTPRSGTTWIGQALGRSRDTAYVHEPDGPNDAYALKAKLGLGLHNELLPGDDAPHYETLWQHALAGGRLDLSARGRLAKHLLDSSRLRDRTAALRGDPLSARLRVTVALATPLRPRRQVNVVAKSVHACLAVEWVVEKFDPSVVVVRRHPLNVLASWKTLGQGGDARLLARLADLARRRWGVHLRIDDASDLARRAMSYGVLMGALSQAATSHPEWIEVRHEDLCVDPVPRFTKLARDVGLDFADDAATYVRQSNRPGQGYETKRVASTIVDKWRQLLTEREVDEALMTLDAFPSELRLLE